MIEQTSSNLTVRWIHRSNYSGTFFLGCSIVKHTIESDELRIKDPSFDLTMSLSELCEEDKEPNLHFILGRRQTHDSEVIIDHTCDLTIAQIESGRTTFEANRAHEMSLIQISEPTRLGMI